MELVLRYKLYKLYMFFEDIFFPSKTYFISRPRPKTVTNTLTLLHLRRASLRYGSSAKTNSYLATIFAIYKNRGPDRLLI